MAPTTSEQTLKRSEYDTLHRQRFVWALDHKQPSCSFNSLCKQQGIEVAPGTARGWIKEREKLGEKALRRTRKLSTRLGRKRLVSASTLDTITDKSSPIHTAPYETQIKELDLNCALCTLQHNASTQRNAKRYKKGQVKPISKWNKHLRTPTMQQLLPTQASWALAVLILRTRHRPHLVDSCSQFSWGSGISLSTLSGLKGKRPALAHPARKFLDVNACFLAGL
jgi:hypothetical protein